MFRQIKFFRQHFSELCAVFAACKTVIVEAEKVVEPGEIEPEDVMTPFVLVDYIVEGGKN